ncbi:hypothetical protein RB195_001981 [Necator americanus]
MGIEFHIKGRPNSIQFNRMLLHYRLEVVKRQRGTVVIRKKMVDNELRYLIRAGEAFSSPDWILRFRMAKKRSAIKANYVRLMVKIELSDSRPFTQSDFELFVRQTVQRVLGSCGPQVQVGDYDELTHKGNIIVGGADAQLVWAALTISGQHQERTIAAHFFSLTEFYAGEDFILTPVF